MRHLVSLGVVAVLAGGPVLAQPSLPMTSAATNRINATDVDPDERFFLVKGAPSNIFFILDSSGSMNELVVSSDGLPRPADGHCADPTYDAALPSGFVATGNYPPPDLGVDPGNADNGYPDLFKQNHFYRRTTGADSYHAVDGMTEQGVANNRTYTSAVTACETVKSNQRTRCQQCMQTKGYFLGHSSGTTKAEVFRGQFLNVYPPKFVTARQVLKKVIWESDNVRMGLSIFDGGNGGQMVRRFAPACSQLQNEDSPAWLDAKRQLLKDIGDKNNAGITFNDSTPLAEALFHAAQYFVPDSTFNAWFGNNWRKNSFAPESITSDNRTVCYGCQLNAVVLISDGEPTSDGDIPQAIKNLNITCSGPGCTGSGAYLDDVASWFYNRDLQTENPSNGSWSAAGKQVLQTYTIGFGIDIPLLQSAADNGDGEYQPASDATSLAEAIVAAIEDVKSRAMAFGSTSVASLQTSSEGSSLIPRFVPSAAGEPWRGYLYRFKLENESVNGCAPVAAGAPPHPKDLDRDRKCTTLAFVDRDGDMVQEDPTSGNFIKASTGARAVPIWEAGKMLTYGSMTADADSQPPDTSPADRKIWTVVDQNGDGRIDAADPLIEFTEDNADKLMNAMGLRADVRGDADCRSIYSKLGLGGDVESTLQTWGETCAKHLINHYRGVDVTNPTPGLRSKTRPWLLADIFHSSPVVVEPPALPESCAYFPGQCLASLWAKGGNFNEPDTREAYTDFVGGASCGTADCEKRRIVALVGSNGGFLHAFDMGGVQGTPERDLLTGRLAYDDPGTGKELWAFVPPDILGVLKSGLDRHTFMVDGTPMVREVWADGSGSGGKDGVKQASEFKTVAVVGTGGGGRHFFALDVTQDAQSTRKPSFRWMWPQPNDPRAADVGDSFSNFYPRPPPIGPVLLESSSGFDFTYREPNAAGTAFEEKPTVKAEERWIVGLNGGLDRTLQRGRGFALVDVWSGATLWDFFWEPGLASNDPRRELNRPVAAGLALLDMGSGELTAEAPFDGYFDTFTVGDLGGNVWVGRMHAPGKLNAGGKVTNWHAGRGFQTAKATAQNRRPISFLTSNALQKNTGYLRTFFGTGDRSALLENTPGVCELNNLSGCVEMGCRVELTEWQSRMPTGVTKRSTHWNAFLPDTQTQTASGTCFSSKCAEPKIAACVQHCNALTCGLPSGAPLALGMRACIDAAQATCPAGCNDAGGAPNGLLSLVSVTGCPSTSTNAPALHPPIVRAVYARCAVETEHRFVPATDGSGTVTAAHYDAWACRSSTYRNDSGVSYRYNTAAVTSAIFHGFVGAHLYGGTPSRSFATATGARNYDTARLTETNLVNLGQLSTPTTLQGTPTGPGWHVRYDGKGERTASPAGMTASFTGESMCVVWNSLTATNTPVICSDQGAQSAKLIQADFVTGSPLCLEQYPTGQRFVSRSVLSPPPEPARATIISAGGVSSGLVTAEPGHPPQFISGFTNTDPLQPVYQLELTSQEHQCRHVGVAAACGI